MFSFRGDDTFVNGNDVQWATQFTRSQEHWIYVKSLTYTSSKLELKFFIAELQSPAAVVTGFKEVAFDDKCHCTTLLDRQ